MEANNLKATFSFLLHVFRKLCDEQIFHYETEGNYIRSHYDDQVVVLTFEKEPLISIDWDKKTLEWNRWKVLVKKVAEHSFMGPWNGDIQVEEDKVLFSHNRLEIANVSTEPDFVIEYVETR